MTDQQINPVLTLLAERDRLEAQHVAAIKRTDAAATDKEREAAEAAQDEACATVSHFEREVLFMTKPSTREDALALLAAASSSMSQGWRPDALQAIEAAHRFLKRESLLSDHEAAEAEAEAEPAEDAPSPYELALAQRDRAAGLAFVLELTAEYSRPNKSELRGISQLLADNAKSAAELHEAIRAGLAAGDSIFDRVSTAFHAARALEYAIAVAPIEATPRDALLGLAMAHADFMAELLDDAEKADDRPSGESST